MVSRTDEINEAVQVVVSQMIEITTHQSLSNVTNVNLKNDSYLN